MAKKLALAILLMVSVGTIIGSDYESLNRMPQKKTWVNKVLTCRNAERCAWLGGMIVIGVAAYTTATVCREMQPACEAAHASLDRDEAPLRAIRHDLDMCRAALNITQALACKLFPEDC